MNKGIFWIQIRCKNASESHSSESLATKSSSNTGTIAFQSSNGSLVHCFRALHENVRKVFFNWIENERSLVGFFYALLPENGHSRINPTRYLV